MLRPTLMDSLSQIDRKQPDRSHIGAPDGEAGFMLLAVIVMVTLLLIALSVAAPVVARQLRRDKEVESQHRMEQYVRALQLYQRKFAGQYPPSIKVLENTNNIRFLRHTYVDPLTGKADYRLIHQGEQKTKIHVFFGQELGGLAGNLGSASGMASAGGMGTPMGGASSTSTIGATSALASGFSGANITTAAPGATGATSASGVTTPTGPPGQSGSLGGLGDGTGGVIVGVGTAKSGTSITEPNGQSTYETWEFWYDPRIEMLKQSVSLTGGGMSSQSATSFGQNGVTGEPNSGAPGTSSPFGSFGATPGSPGTPGSTGASGTTGSTGTTGTNNPNSSTPNPF